MALYNNITTRGGSGGSNLVPVEQAAQIITNVTRGSAALRMFRHIPMSRLQDRVPVLSALPSASFVTGEASGTYGASSGLKQTTSIAWEGRILQAEEIAAIVPIPEQLLADSQYDIWGEMAPLISEAIGRALDAAVFFGVGAPASYGQPLIPAATQAGNTATVGTASQASGALAADIANLIGTVETDGYDVNGAIANTTMRARARNARMTTGQELSEIQVAEWYGQPVEYVLRGMWPTAAATFTATTTSGSATLTAVTVPAGLAVGDAITGTGVPAGSSITAIGANTVTLNQNATATATTITMTPVAPSALLGDFSQGLLGVRQDLTYKVLTEAALFDASGALQINLPQQDAVALRVVARFGYQTANAVTYDQPTEANRFPFGVLLG